MMMIMMTLTPEEAHWIAVFGDGWVWLGNPHLNNCCIMLIFLL